MILGFSNKTKLQKDALIGEGYFYLQEAAKLGKSLEIVEVKAKKPSKSHEQLKGAYKLFQMSLPHFQKWKPKVIWTLEEIKEFAKAELGYVRDSKPFEIGLMLKLMGFNMKEEDKADALKWCKKIKQNLSFADFSKEQLYNFTKEYEVWAQTAQYKEGKEIKPAWSDVYLTTEETQALVEFFNKKE